MPSSSHRFRPVQQRVHIATSTDNVQLAWARSGSGPTLVKASNWMTHLREDVDSPVWGHWIHFLSSYFDFVRFDERGCGLSDRQVPMLVPYRLGRGASGDVHTPT